MVRGRVYTRGVALPYLYHSSGARPSRRRVCEDVSTRGWVIVISLTSCQSNPDPSEGRNHLPIAQQPEGMKQQIALARINIMNCGTRTSW